jgi:hypothetical protein
MGLVYIKFGERAHAARAIEELSQRTRVDGYRGGIWAVKREFLSRLDELDLPYELASDEEVEAALAAVRHPVASVLQ